MARNHARKGARSNPAGSISLTPTQKWYVAVGIVTAVVFVVGFMVFIQPRTSQAGNANSKAQQVQQESATLQTELSQLKAKAVQLPQEEAVAANINQKFPTTADQNDLLNQINDAATSSGITASDISGLTLGVPTVVPQGSQSGVTLPQTGASASPASQASQAAEAGQLASMSVVLSVTAPSTKMTGFLQALENGKRAFLLNTVTVSPASFTINGAMFVVPAAELPPAIGGSAPVTAPVQPSTATKPGSSHVITPAQALSASKATQVSGGIGTTTYLLVGALVFSLGGVLLFRKKQQVKNR